MNKTLKKILFLAMSLTLVLGLLTACGGPKTLEEALQDEDVQEELSSLETDGVTITAKGNMLIYTYTFDESYDFSDATIKEAVVSSLQSSSEEAEDAFESVVEELENSTGIDDISMKVSYLEAGGAVLYEHTYDF